MESDGERPRGHAFPDRLRRCPGSARAVRRRLALCRQTGPSNHLAAGLNRFNFKGADWARHATRGIDWDVYTFFPEAPTQQFLIGNWGHGCQSSRETGEYQAYNGAPFAEIQDILRVHDSGSFTTLFSLIAKPRLHPYCDPADVRYSDRAGRRNFLLQRLRVDMDERECQYSDGLGRLGTFGVRNYGLGRTAGGCCKTGPDRLDAGRNRTGARVLTLPPGWTPDRRVAMSGTAWSQVYSGGAQAAPLTIVFKPAAAR